MSDTINIEKSVKSFHSSPENGEYSKVILHIDDETYVEAGNDTGRTLEANCPFATQQIANNLLNRLKGFRYQPYAADGAFFDPAAELGDGVTVGDIFGGIYSQDIKFDSLCGSNIEAPQDGDIEHEYPYEAKKDREVTRQIKKRVTQSQAESIINQEMDKITLSVSGEGGATTFEIKKDTATLSSETVDLKVKSVNIEGELSADKIKGGTLALGGDNNINGKIVILNAAGQPIAESDWMGISFYSGLSQADKHIFARIGRSGISIMYSPNESGGTSVISIGGNYNNAGGYGQISVGSVSSGGTITPKIILDGDTGKIECKSLYINGQPVTP